MAEEGYEARREYCNVYKWLQENKNKVIFSWHFVKNEVHATGNTYPVRQLLKQAGFKWEGGMWVKKLPVPDPASPEINFDTERHNATIRAEFAKWYSNFKPVEQEIQKVAPTVWIEWAGPDLLVIINPEKVK